MINNHIILQSHLIYFRKTRYTIRNLKKKSKSSSPFPSIQTDVVLFLSYNSPHFLLPLIFLSSRLANFFSLHFLTFIVFFTFSLACFNIVLSHFLANCSLHFIECFISEFILSMDPIPLVKESFIYAR